MHAHNNIVHHEQFITALTRGLKWGEISPLFAAHSPTEPNIIRIMGLMGHQAGNNGKKMAHNNATPTWAHSLAGSNRRQGILLIVAVAATVALLASIWASGQPSEYRAWHGNFTEGNGKTFGESLPLRNVTHQFADGKYAGGNDALLRPANQVHEITLHGNGNDVTNAGSVPGMLTSNAAAPGQGSSSASLTHEVGADRMNASQINYAQQIEQAYVDRIESIIMPLVGANNVRAQVMADIDFTQIELTAETYESDHKHTPNPTTGKGSGTAGTNSSAAHTLRNTPVADAVDRIVRHTKLPVGIIKRLSVAVVINHRTDTDPDGNPRPRPLNQNELEQITTLVKDAMGFDVNRGDSLNILNSAFYVEQESPVVEIPLWNQPEQIALVKDITKYLLITGITLVLLLGIIRPSLKIFATSATTQRVASRGHPEPSSVQQPNNSFEENLQAAKQMAQQEPKVVAAVVKQWMSGNA